MKSNGKFDAKFEVVKPINLALHDEENRLHDRSIWCGPDASLFTIEPVVYYVDGLNLDEKGLPQDEYYWSDDPKSSHISSLGAADLRALEEFGVIALLEGSFNSNDPYEN